MNISERTREALFTLSTGGAIGLSLLFVLFMVETILRIQSGTMDSEYFLIDVGIFAIVVFLVAVAWETRPR